MKNWLVCVRGSYPGAHYLAILIDTSEIYAHVVYGPKFVPGRHPALATRENIIPLCKLSKADAEKLTPKQALEKNKHRIRVLPAEAIELVKSIIAPMHITIE